MGEKVLISTSPAYKLLFLPTPVIYKVSPPPGELVGGGQQALYLADRLLSSHPIQTPARGHDLLCDAAARPVHTGHFLASMWV